MLDATSLKSFLQAKLPDAIEMLRRMVEINSFTENAQGVNRLGQLTAQGFEPLGFAAEFVPSTHPGWGNHLVLTRPGRSGRSIAMVAHLDTVYSSEEEARNNFRWQPEGDRIYGPGTDDMKGGTVLIWMVLSALRHHAPDVFEQVTWKLFWNSSEERFSPDFGDLCRRRMERGTLAALVFEGEGRSGGPGLLVLARKGRATWRVTAKGRGAHAGGKHKHGANAVVQLAQTIQKIAALTDYSKDLTFTTGVLRAGDVLNRVPHEAVAEGEFRAFTPAAYEGGKAALLALAGPGEVKSPADGYACQVKVELLTESRPWPRNPGTDGLYAIWERAAAQVGVPIGSEERGGLSDGNELWDVVPTLDGLGPGGDNAHCSERSADGSKVPEYVDTSTFVDKAALNVAALISLATTGIP